jgi:hypothetical protein
VIPLIGPVERISLAAMSATYTGSRHAEEVGSGARSRAMIGAIVMLILIALSGTPASAADRTTTLDAGATLQPDESVWSADHLIRLTQQADGNLVLYAMPGSKPLWASNTRSRTAGTVTQMQSDGNFVVYAPGHVARWASGTAGRPGAVLQVQDDANVVVYAPGHVALWGTGGQRTSHCADGSRIQAKDLAAAGGFYEPFGAVAWSERPPIGAPGNLFTYSVKLRYDPDTRCAWALVAGAATAHLWIDRSADGGRTWSGVLGYRDVHLGQSTTYGGAFSDSFPYVVRACADGAALSPHCTPWY